MDHCVYMYSITVKSLRYKRMRPIMNQIFKDSILPLYHA